MNIDLSEELVKSVLPNTLITVDEETPLAARIEPYVKHSIIWLESVVVGDVELPEALQELAERAVIIRAFLHAIPALDLVVTPSGFGVISSQGLAPASKERIERLIQSLSRSLNDIIFQLQSKCVECEDWRNSARGRYYCCTFFPYLRDAAAFAKEGEDVFDVYRQARGLAAEFENDLAEEYLGRDLLEYLKNIFYNGSYDHGHVIDTFLIGMAKYVSRNIHSRGSRCPDEHIPWHFAESILNLVKQDKKLRKIWKDSMGKKFDVEPFKNTRKGGYFF